MFELKRSYHKQPQQFKLLLERVDWYKIWKIMNEVKPIHLIPGLNMMTVYQLSEYFEIPIRLIQNIENKYHLGNSITRRYVQSDEFSFLALNKKRVKFDGGIQHWQYDFRDFSIHMASAGAICYSPQLVEEFLPYITGSQVCSDIIVKIIKSIPHDTLRYMSAEGLLRSVEEYEAEQQKNDAEKAKELEVTKVINKVLAEMKIEQPTVTIEVTVNI